MWLSILIGALIVCAGLYRIAEAIEKNKICIFINLQNYA